MSVTVAMTYADAIRVAHSARRASDLDLSLAYDSLEAYEIACELEDAERLDADVEAGYDPERVDLDAVSMSPALNALDVEMYRREAYFPMCSRAGMREAA